MVQNEQAAIIDTCPLKMETFPSQKKKKNPKQFLMNYESKWVQLKRAPEWLRSLSVKLCIAVLMYVRNQSENYNW